MRRLDVGMQATKLRVDVSRNLEQEFIDASKKVTRCGWTVPAAMAPREFFYIATLDDRDAIDDHFQAFYQRTGIPFPGLRLSQLALQDGMCSWLNVTRAIGAAAF
jgi:hypothetical protein